MVAPTVDRTQRQSRSAFTLLEVLVVLIILAVGATLVMSLPRRDRAGDGAVPVLMERASGIAVQRGQYLILNVASDGAWALQSEGATDTVPVAEGRLARKPAVALSARLTPFGGCSSLAGADRHLDVLRCRPLPVAGGAQ